MIDNDEFYPDVNDPDIQYKLFLKKENQYYLSDPIEDFGNNYEKIREYRDEVCKPKGAYYHQLLLNKLINPNTPYKGLLLFHGLGSGKTYSAISIAEEFSNQINQYKTFIYILVKGPLLASQWERSIVDFTPGKYTNNGTLSIHKDMNKITSIINQQYKILSYKSFNRRVMGERQKIIMDVDGVKKQVYKKDEDQKDIRSESVNKIYHLNNSLIIVDEVQNLLNDNSYSKSLKQIIDNSKNLKVLLLSATPAGKKADNVVGLINFLRPPNSQMDVDRIFKCTDDGLEIKKDGLDYFKLHSSGYVSYIKGDNPYLFAKRVDMGIIPNGLKYTKLVRCKMSIFQYDVYKKIVGIDKDIDDDDEKNAFSRPSIMASLCVFPILDESNNLIGTYGKKGLEKLFYLLKNPKILNEKLKIALENNDDTKTTFIQQKKIKNGVSFSGDILNIKNINLISCKFYYLLNHLNNVGPKNIFIFTNLIFSGTNIIQEMLLENGYHLYNENGYNVNNKSKCYYCGVAYVDHNGDNFENHEFEPATFLVITGSSEYDIGEDNEASIKRKILYKTFNNNNNMYGKHIKIVIGTEVMDEGIELKNVSEVHVLNNMHTTSKLDQIVGRAIRNCSHNKLSSVDNVFPEVRVYKYVAYFDENELGIEEELYKNAENRHVVIKHIERALKEVSIDCPFNYNMNFHRELLNNDKHNYSVECDYQQCEYKCNSHMLNKNYYDSTRHIYNSVPDDKIDMLTFNYLKNTYEINIVKDIIKQLFYIDYYFTLDEIIVYVKNNYPFHRKKLYDEFYVYKALDTFLLTTNDEFNNYNEVLLDKYSNRGYLIYRNIYYIFQPIDKSEYLTIFYRNRLSDDFIQSSSVVEFLNRRYQYNSSGNVTNYHDLYRYDDEYYDNRSEWKYVGIIAKELSRGKVKKLSDIQDVFKIRPQLLKNLDKKRATGVYSFLGGVCSSSKDREYLLSVAKDLNINISSNVREKICSLIMNEMLILEKKSRGDNKITYIVIPTNHPKYPFPYNLEDRYLRMQKLINDLFVDDITEGILQITYDFKKLSIIVKCSDLKFNEFFESNKFKKLSDGFSFIYE